MPRFNPKISIVIPVYNGSNYLREAIDSALVQTYDNFEVIVFNDGSTDGGATEQIALSYGSRIRYYSKENGGVATALNAGIEKAEGEYISWLSHDDMYSSDKLSMQVEKLKISENRDNLILYTNYELINEKGKLINRVCFDHSMLIRKPLYGLLRGCIHGCSLLIPKRAFEEVGYFKPELKTTQDYDLWFHMFRQFTFEHMEDITVKSRWHDEQDSKKSPHTLNEANELWIMFLDELTDVEILSCENSRYEFFNKMVVFLKETPYKGAYEYAVNISNLEKDKLLSMTEKIKISVVLPFYNRVDLLQESVDSVLNQTHTNFELIIIDDGSTEGAPYLKKLTERDSRVKLIELEKNCGAAYSRNKGIEKASGIYIAFIDADDLWLENKLEKQLYYMVSNSYSFSHTSYIKFDSNGLNKKISTLENSGNIFPEFVQNCLISTPTVMVHKSALMENGFFFREDYKYAEDICLWLDISEKYEVGCLDEYLAMVRMHGNNAATDKEKQLGGLLNIACHLGCRYPREEVKDQIYWVMESIRVVLGPPSMRTRFDIYLKSYRRTRLYNVLVPYMGFFSFKTFPCRVAEILYPGPESRDKSTIYQLLRKVYRKIYKA